MTELYSTFPDISFIELSKGNEFVNDLYLRLIEARTIGPRFVGLGMENDMDELMTFDSACQSGLYRGIFSLNRVSMFVYGDARVMEKGKPVGHGWYPKHVTYFTIEDHMLKAETKRAEGLGFDPQVISETIASYRKP